MTSDEYQNDFPQKCHRNFQLPKLEVAKINRLLGQKSFDDGEENDSVDFFNPHTYPPLREKAPSPDPTITSTSREIDMDEPSSLGDASVTSVAYRECLRKKSQRELGVQDDSDAEWDWNPQSSRQVRDFVKRKIRKCRKKKKDQKKGKRSSVPLLITIRSQAEIYLG